LLKFNVGDQHQFVEETLYLHVTGNGSTTFDKTTILGLQKIVIVGYRFL
jgi:hypothetical protein